METTVIHKGKNMHATLSFVYPDDELKLKDAINGEKYRIALERIRKIINGDANMLFMLTSIETELDIAFGESL